MSAPTGHPDVAPAGDDAGPPAEDDRPKVYLDLPEVSSSSFRQRRPSRWWRIGFPIALVLLVAAVPLLVYLGGRIVRIRIDGTVEPFAAGLTRPAAIAVLDDGAVVVAEDTGRLLRISTARRTTP